MNIVARARMDRFAWAFAASCALTSACADDGWPNPVPEKGTGGASSASSSETGSTIGASSSITVSGGSSSTTASSASSTGAGSGGGTGDGIPCAPGTQVPCVLVDNLPSVRGLTTDGTVVFFTTGGFGPWPTGRVWDSSALAYGPPPTVLVDALDAPSDPKLVGATLYWLDQRTYPTPSAIWRLDVSGPHLLHESAGLSAYAVDASNAYWLDSTAQGPLVSSCSLAGCTPTPMLQASIDDLTPSGTDLFWTVSTSASQRGIYRCHPANCQPTVVVTPTPSLQGPLRMADGHVYFRMNGAIQRCPLDASPCTPESVWPTPSGDIVLFEVDGLKLFSMSDVMGQTCVIAERDAQNLERVLAQGSNCQSPGSLAQQGAYVYWSDPQAGRVMRVAK